MQAALRIRELLIASWDTSEEGVRKALPAGLEPARVGGRHLVSLVAFHVRGGVLGRFPILPFTQLNARTYVTWKGEPAVFFIGARVTWGGLPGRLLGAPYRQARLRLSPGSIRAPGLGVSLRFRIAEPAEPGPLGHHELGLFEHNGLRAIRIHRGDADWRRAELFEPARADLLIALGLEPRGEPELLYAERASFETEVPTRRV